MRRWLLLLGLWAFGCGTDAIGIETCRSIESARCEAAAACGMIQDVEKCQRFARDHCLHGLSLDREPTATQVNRCVDTLELVGRCADRDGKNSDLLTCREDGSLGTDAENVCEIALEPELAPRCRFLIPPEPEPEPSSEPSADADADAGAE